MNYEDIWQKQDEITGRGQLPWIFPMGLALRPFIFLLSHGVELAFSRRSVIVLLLLDAISHRL